MTRDGDDMRRAENRHHVKVSLLRWRIVRHDGALLGGCSRREDAERCCRVINREGLEPIATVRQAGRRA